MKGLGARAQMKQDVELTMIGYSKMWGRGGRLK